MPDRITRPAPDSRGKRMPLKSVCIAIVVLAIANVGVSAAAPDAPADIDFSRDVVYGKGGDVDLKLSVARPKGDKGPLPCVVFIHGGGWAQGSKEHHDAQTIDFARRGYVGVT